MEEYSKQNQQEENEILEKINSHYNKQLLKEYNSEVCSRIIFLVIKLLVYIVLSIVFSIKNKDIGYFAYIGLIYAIVTYIIFAYPRFGFLKTFIGFLIILGGLWTFVFEILENYNILQIIIALIISLGCIAYDIIKTIKLIKYDYIK